MRLISRGFGTVPPRLWLLPVVVCWLVFGGEAPGQSVPPGAVLKGTGGLKNVDPRFEDELIPINLGGYWGLMNQNAYVIALPSLDWTDFGVDGLARGVINGKTGFIVGDGDWYIDPTFDYVDRFEEGYAVFRINKQKQAGFIDRRGRVVLRPELDDALRFRDGLAGVRVGKRCGFVNQRFDLEVPLIYTAVRSFHEGLAAVRLPKAQPAAGNGNGNAQNKDKDKDKDINKGAWGYINRRGTMVFQDPSEKITALGDFNDSVAVVCVGERWGYLNKRFEFEIQPQFEAARDFVGGMAAVKFNGKWGYIDRAGNPVIVPTYEAADDFDDRLAMVKLNGKYGFIDRTGRVVVPMAHESAEPVRLKYGRVSIPDDTFGYVGVSGRLKFDPRAARWGIIDLTLQEKARLNTRNFDPYNNVIRIQDPRDSVEVPYPPEYQYDEGLAVPDPHR